jgi:hypothetical protein
VAVYDSVTGDVVRHDIDTDHGLAPEGLIWSDAATLLFGYGQQVTGDGGPMEEQGMSTSGPWLIWRVGRDAPVVAALGSAAVEDANAGRILVSGNSRYAVTDAEKSSRRVFGIRQDLSVSPVIDASGLQVAVVSGESQEPGWSGVNPNRVLVGRLPARWQGHGREELVMRELPDSENTFDAVAWADGQHVVLLQAADESSWNSPDLVVVDVRTGEKQVLTRSAERRTNALSPHYATGLFSQPPIASPEPPHPWDPRVSTGLAAAVLLAGAGVLVVWRRRARA